MFTFPESLSWGLSWLIGGPGRAILFWMPLKPRAKMALKAKCGFISAPGTRTSKRVAGKDTEGGEIMRMEAALESYPYVTALGAQKASPPMRRLYPLIVGTSWEQLNTGFQETG